jgi:alpha-L-glutamate ligase-like protein
VSLIGELHRAGVMGMNRRNYDYVQRWNPRRLYPLVDDKLITKDLCREAGVPIPELIGAIRHHYELRHLRDIIGDSESFVVKPARGSQGNGILVIRGRRDAAFVRSNGEILDEEDIKYHASEILSGLFSLGGQADSAIVEECLKVHPDLARVASGGVPDLRLLVYRGVPVAAMLRLPTERAAGRANLHQGAIGAGVDLATGLTSAAVLGNRYVETHPDTGHPVVGIEVPGFDALLEIGVRISDTTGLGYLGVDLVVDAARGPVVLELNARPGLAIQLANRVGLLPRLEAVDERLDPEAGVAERVALGRELAR